MPCCDGLPDGPCSYVVNNHSIKLSQGDLMLCPRCEAVCFPPAPVNSCLESASGNTYPSMRKAMSSATNSLKSISTQLQSVAGKLDAKGTDAPEHSEDSSIQASKNATSIINSAKGIHSLHVVVTDTDIRASFTYAKLGASATTQ
jgi:hypothetical protein